MSTLSPFLSTFFFFFFQISPPFFLWTDELTNKNFIEGQERCNFLDFRNSLRAFLAQKFPIWQIENVFISKHGEGLIVVWGSLAEFE